MKTLIGSPAPCGRSDAPADGHAAVRLLAVAALAHRAAPPRPARTATSPPTPRSGSAGRPRGTATIAPSPITSMPASRRRIRPPGRDLQPRVDPVAGLVGPEHLHLGEVPLRADPPSVLAQRGDGGVERFVVLARDLGPVADRQLEGGQGGRGYLYGAAPMSGPATRPRLTVALLAIGAAMAFAGGCGDDDDDDQRARRRHLVGERAGRVRRREARTRSPCRCPRARGRCAKDAEARAAILVSVRDELTALGTPEGVDGEALSAYLDQLELDIAEARGRRPDRGHAAPRRVGGPGSARARPRRMRRIRQRDRQNAVTSRLGAAARLDRPAGRRAGDLLRALAVADLRRSRGRARPCRSGAGGRSSAPCRRSSPSTGRPSPRSAGSRRSP